MLPYLQGERTPVWDEQARGAFFGLDLTHGRGHLVRALFEGIALGFADCLAVARDAGTRVDEAIAANGAGKSALAASDPRRRDGDPRRVVERPRRDGVGGRDPRRSGDGRLPWRSRPSSRGRRSDAPPYPRPSRA